MLREEFAPYLTPPASPPAAMLAALIRGIQDVEIPKAGIPKAGTSQIPRTEG
jgi:hypothetical protein